MAVETVTVSKARRLALAGFSLVLLLSWSPADGADSSSQRTTLRDLAGNRVGLAAPANGVTALVFYSTECPISNSYSPTLTTLMESFPAQSVKWVGVCVDPDLTRLGGEDPRPRLQLEVPGRSRSERRFRSQARRQSDTRGVRDRRRREGPLSRPDRRPVRRAPQAQRQSLGERTEDGHCGRLERQRGEGRLRRGRSAVRCPKSTTRPRRPTARTSRRSCRRTARNATARARWARSRWRPTSRPANARPTSPPWPKTGDAAVESRPERRRQVQGRTRAFRARTSQRWSPGPRRCTLGNPADLPPTQVSRRLAARHARPGDRHRRRFPGPGRGRRHLPLLRGPHQARRRTSTSRPSSTGRATVGSSITSWPTSISRVRPAKRDLAEPGPGYTCFGGPGEPIHGGLGGWAPGNQPTFLPDGIGRSLAQRERHHHPGPLSSRRARPKPIAASSASTSPKKPIKQVMHWGVVINPGPRAAAWPVQYRSQGRLGGPRRRHRVGRDPAHASAWVAICRSPSSSPTAASKT